LNLLTGFEALIIEGSVSAAARRARLSQPAMSNLLARLRKTFGDPLFERVGRRMVPTLRAKQMATAVCDALEIIRKTIGERPSFVPSTTEATFSVASTDYVEAAVLPSLLRTIRRAAPRLVLRMKRVKAIFEVPIAELDVCDFALGLFPSPLPPGAGLRGTALFQERFVGVLSERHPLARQKFGLREFLSLEHIRVNYSEEGPGFIGDAVQKLGHRRKVGLVVPHLVTVPFLAADSEMLGIVPLRLAQAFSSSLGLRILELPIALPPLTLSLIWHERHGHDPAHRWLREFITLKHSTLM
jgi:DNA-binding transcriptional LysR family regulator